MLQVRYPMGICTCHEPVLVDKLKTRGILVGLFIVLNMLAEVDLRQGLVHPCVCVACLLAHEAWRKTTCLVEKYTPTAHFGSSA